MKKLPITEFIVMDVIWGCEEKVISTNNILERINAQNTWTRATVSTLLNRLVVKGFLKTTKKGKERSFSWKVSREEYVRFETEQFISNYHHSSIAQLASSLSDIKMDELDELEQWIRDHKEKMR